MLRPQESLVGWVGFYLTPEAKNLELLFADEYVMLKNPDKSIELGNQLLSQYPDSPFAPRSLFLMGSFVYDDMLQDTAQAHVMLQRLIDEYPQSKHVEDAKRAIWFLGLTPEQIMSIMAMEQMTEE